MRCQSCDHDNREGASFCDACGSALGLVCPSCSAELRPGARFCDSCGAALGAGPARRATPTPAPAPAPALPTSLAAGRYQVQRFLGEGGKKRVYLAQDSRLDRDVAVAIIKTDGIDEAGLKRIEREAQAMGRLGDQANIVTVYDIGDDSGQPYIVSQYMAGGDLDSVLASSEDHRLPVARAIGVAEQVCAALEHAHAHAVIHRDLKPGNIWLANDGSAKLGDFGLAVAIDRSRLTREGMMVGTTSYMPPEQAVGGEVTPRSDLYSLGCVLYEMVTGRPPFLGEDSVGIISQHINTAPVSPSWHNPEVPKALELLILRLLAKAPNERPDSAAVVSAELRAIRERSTVESVAEAQSPAANLQGLSWGQFVGRRQEMDQLKSALENALSGRGTLAMLVGEPGIGKTRLAEEFAVYASLRGARVLTGHCFEGEVTLPYRPFIEAFQQYIKDRPDAELRGELGTGAPEVAKLVSEVRQRFPDIPQAQPLEADEERLRLHESIASFLGNASQSTPIVLVLDDIHWADKPSLLMMRYLARAIVGQRILILGAYRDVELDRTHPLAEVMAKLRQETQYRRVLIRGLPESDVLGLLESVESSEETAAGRQALAAALYQETEGNPFFIREVLTHLIEEGKLVHEGGHWRSHVSTVEELGIPEGVREVVGRRLSRVSEECNRMLTLASTMTGGFSWEELKAVADVGDAELIELVEEALAAQLIQERKGGQAGMYDFTHALIRQTLYGELSTPRRVVLHRQIGNALEAFYGAGVDAHLSELAHHFYQAAPGGDVDKAIEFAKRAGDRAVEQLAYEEATQHYELALQAFELKDVRDDDQHYGLLVAAGTAYTKASLPRPAVAYLNDAMEIALQAGDPDQVARTAILLTDATVRESVESRSADLELLSKGLDAVGPEESELRSRLLSRRARYLIAGPPEERLAMAREAEAMAERLGENLALVEALNTIEQILRTTFSAERDAELQAVQERWLQAAEQEQDESQMLYARQSSFLSKAVIGDIEGFRREAEETVKLADRMRQPAFSAWRPVFSASLALLKGRWDEALDHFSQSWPVAVRMRSPGYFAATSAQIFEALRCRGQLDQLEEQTIRGVRLNPDLPGYHASVPVLMFEIGKPEEARDWYAKLFDLDLERVPGGVPSIVAHCAFAARRLSDASRSEYLYQLGERFRGRQLNVGGAVFVGAAERALGMLAATLGRYDDAVRDFEAALEFDRKLDAPPYLAMTQYEYALTLHERDAPGDAERAFELVNEALPVFEELGMPNDVQRAVTLKMQLQGVDNRDLYTSIDALTATVQVERPDLRAHAAPDGTVTLLFTDIVDSTPLNERLGDQRWMELLREHNDIVRSQVADHQGYEVKTEGDGFMIAFSSARRALQCAIAIQHAFARRNETADEPVRVRAGLHTGEMIQDAGDFYGRHVNLAARIASEAKGGEILVSALLKELTESGGDVEFGKARNAELKGLAGTQRVFPVDWHSDAYRQPS